MTEVMWVATPARTGPVGLLIEGWAYRHLTLFLAVRSLQKIYRRTALGWAWLLILPLFPIVMRTLVFGGLIGVTTGGIPYLLFLTVGTVTWDFFASALMWSTRGLEMHRGVLDQLWVPKIIMPIATMAPSVIDLAINVVVLLVAVLYYYVTDGRTYILMGPRVLWAFAAVGLAFLLAFSISLFTSVWGESARRDSRFIMGQIIGVWMLLTPLLYPISQVPAEYRRWVYLNPMAAVLETFKWSLLGIGELNVPALAVAAAVTATILTGGLVFFSYRARVEADGA